MVLESFLAKDAELVYSLQQCFERSTIEDMASFFSTVSSVVALAACQRAKSPPTQAKTTPIHSMTGNVLAYQLVLEEDLNF